MSSSSSPDWIKFFSSAGIPSRYAAKYAVIFNDHRIQEDMLKDLNKEILYDMGIKTMGDVIAIMRHAKDVDEERSRDRVLSGRAPAPAPTPDAAVKRQVRRVVSVEDKTESPASLSNSMSRRLGPTAAPVRKAEVTSAPVREQVVKRVITGSGTADRMIRLPTGSGSGSVFQRLGGTADEISTLTSGSALRGLSLTASSMPLSATKATATVRPTRGTPYSVKERLGGKGASGREVVSSNLKLKSDPPAASRTQVVSLKRSIFDRLGS